MSGIVKFRKYDSSVTMIRFLFFLFPVLILQLSELRGQPHIEVPFSVTDKHLTIRHGGQHEPVFIKGVNLGVGLPGTQVWDLAATRNDYARWFPMMSEAGFNTIRVFTLHFPHFYEELDRYNRNHPDRPLYLIQGIWLEEEISGYMDDLYQFTDIFDREIMENVRAVHGDISIPTRTGKAWGNYTANISEWTLAYIIGREIFPNEIITTNELNSGINGYSGDYFSIQYTNASEAWLIERLDKLVRFETNRYEVTRPVSFSSWPSLDPIDHPDEPNQYEEMASLDISGVDFSRAPGGIFASYHVYPYYPEYISRDPQYHGSSDDQGVNGYLGYLTRLKGHYRNMPLIIAEFGVPSSWGNAHYAQNGMHYGGHTSYDQGLAGIRMFQNIASSGSGGGIWFSWMDEWFKRTWINQPLDFDARRRSLWHNVMSPEQNFGLIGFRSKNTNLEHWETYTGDSRVRQLWRGFDNAYLYLQIRLDESMAETDSLWISLDTYNRALGEFILPNGQRLIHGAEFAILITNQFAQLYVTQAYDIFGILHGAASPEQRFQSIATTGAPWHEVRWLNNYPTIEVQDIGRLSVGSDPDWEDRNQAVYIKDELIHIRLPWNLIHVTDPSTQRVLHDNRGTIGQYEVRRTDGLHVGIFFRDFGNETSTSFLWPGWNNLNNAYEEYRKSGYFVFAHELPHLTGDVVSIHRFAESVNQSEQHLVIFPNPGNGQFRIQGNRIIDHIEVYTIDGRLVHIQPVHAMNTLITRSDLATGVYLVKIYTEDQVSVHRFTMLR